MARTSTGIHLYALRTTAALFQPCDMECYFVEYSILVGKTDAMYECNWSTNDVYSQHLPYVHENVSQIIIPPVLACLWSVVHVLSNCLPGWWPWYNHRDSSNQGTSSFLLFHISFTMFPDPGILGFEFLRVRTWYIPSCTFYLNLIVSFSTICNLKCLVNS